MTGIEEQYIDEAQRRAEELRECPYGDNYIEARRSCPHVRLMNVDMAENAKEYFAEIVRLNAVIRAMAEFIITVDLDKIICKNGVCQHSCIQCTIDHFTKQAEAK